MSFQWSVPIAAPRAVEPLVAARPGTAQPLSDRDCAYVTADGAAHLLDFNDWQALQVTAVFLPREQHRAALVQQGLARSPQEAQQQLERLQQRGLLVDGGDWLGELAALATPRVPAPIDAIQVRCCDRPEAAAALVESLDEHQSRHGTAIPIRLLDDSRDPAARAALARWCAERDPRRPELALIDERHAHTLVDRLADAAGVPRERARRQLLRHSGGTRFGGGRTLNLALLLSAGRRLMMFDDDMRLPLLTPPGRRDGVDLDAAANAVTRLCDSDAQALSDGDPPDGDALAWHWEACGAGAADWLARRRSWPSLDAIAGRAIGDFTAIGAGSRIVATLNGHRGASGADNTVWMYRLPPDQRAPLARGVEHYRHLLEGDALSFGYPRFHLAERVWFSACALDNGTLLPCTAPGGRGEDALLHTLINLVDPEAVSLDLPLTVAHVPHGSRQRRANNVGAWKPSLNRFLADWLHEQRDRVRAAAPADRVAHVAAILRDRVASSPASRRDWIRDYLRASRCDQIERLERSRQDARDMPPYWHADVESMIVANRAALVDPNAAALADWPMLATDAQVEPVSTWVSDLAAALEDWPRLWSAAAELGPALRAPP